MTMGEAARKAEVDRILEEYGRRARSGSAGLYMPTEPAVLFMIHERVRVLLRLLRAEGLLPLVGAKLLEVGCGTGSWLADFEAWGVERGNIAAIELDPERGAEAQARFPALRDERGRVLSPGADIRIGDASSLPWEAASFDVVFQSTVFTSILNEGMRKAVAEEMMRVAKPGGVILWYDFFRDNPWNPAVRGVGGPEIRSLFPGRSVRLSRVTLAPPIARRLVPLSWTVAHLLEKARLLNTHYLGIIRLPGCRAPSNGGDS